MTDKLYSVQLKNLGGSSRFEKNVLDFKRGDSPKTVIIGHDSFLVKSFTWLENETYNLPMILLGFLIGWVAGFLIGGFMIVGSVFLGIGGGLIGAALLGQKNDTSKLVLTVLDGENEVVLYVRCSKVEFRSLSCFL